MHVSWILWNQYYPVSIVVDPTCYFNSLNFVDECYDCHWTVQYFDFVFQFKSYNTSFTNTEIWIRFTFLFLTFIVTVSVSPYSKIWTHFVEEKCFEEGNNCVLCNYLISVKMFNWKTFLKKKVPYGSKKFFLGENSLCHSSKMEIAKFYLINSWKSSHWL